MTTALHSGVIGREPELAALCEFLEEPSPPALLLRGDPGIGKTTLWEAGIAAARARGLRVLVARPSPAETQLSFAALMDLLETVEAGTLAALPVPQLRALEVALLRAEPASLAPEPRAVNAGFLSALRTLAAREPVLVAIDDVQWLDPSSADALVFAARRLERDAVRFLLARRSRSSSALAHELKPRLLDVGPLSFGATRMILSERLGLTLPRRVLRQLFDSARGNPLFTMELGRALAAGGLPEIGEEIEIPAGLEELLGARVEQFDTGTRRLVLAVALSGDLRRRQLASIADQETIDAAIDAGLLVVDGDRVRASHPLLAAAVRRHSTPSERRALHLQLADAVADGPRRARHLALGTERPDAALAATVGAAAEAESARGAAHEAVVLAEHALRLTPPEAGERADRVLALAEHLIVAGSLERSTALLTTELNALPRGAARGRAHLLLFDGDVASIEEAMDHIELAYAESERDPALRATILARKAVCCLVVLVERVADAEVWTEDALPAARRAGPEAERLVLYVLGWARILRGLPIDDLNDRFRLASDAAAYLLDSLDRVAGIRFAFRGEVQRARAVFSQLLELADERSEQISYAVLRLQLCELELRAGEWEAASRLLDEWAQSSDSEIVRVLSYDRCRALLAAGRGLPDEVARGIELIEGSEATSQRWELLEASRARGLAALRAHDAEQAAESLRAVWEHMQREGVDDPGAFPVAPDLVEALVEVGEHDEAKAVVERLRRLAEEQEHPWGLASAKRCGALLRLASPPYDEAAASELEEAADAYAELGLRFDSARSLLLLGRAQRRSRKWGAARRSLEQAASGFDEIGSPGWADEARAELARVGARRPQASGELTKTEQRVAELASQGLSNKEIAATLFVTVNTVEVHLSKSYAKLGVRSRAQLSGRLSKK